MTALKQTSLVTIVDVREKVETALALVHDHGSHKYDDLFTMYGNTSKQQTQTQTQ